MLKENLEEEAIKKLKKYNQEEIISVLDILSSEERKKIFKQIVELDFDRVDKLYNELVEKEKVTTDYIQEITALNKENLSQMEIEKYNKLGEEIIKTNAYALVTMSGGQGTRLGYNKPKGEFVVNIEPTPKSLFEILADKLKKVNNEHNVIIPWYIMTSPENDEEIKRFFHSNNNFGYPCEYTMFFRQENLPLITENK